MLDLALPVRIYWNYKHRCYSIFQRGAVRASARQVHLTDVTFHVRESGRLKMIREGRKVIHAYACGRLRDYVHPSDTRDLETFEGDFVFYDPYRYEGFVTTGSLEPIDGSGAVRFDENGTRVLLERRLAA